jgi:hypothetical protein
MTQDELLSEIGEYIEWTEALSRDLRDAAEMDLRVRGVMLDLGEMNDYLKRLRKKIADEKESDCI